MEAERWPQIVTFITQDLAASVALAKRKLSKRRESWCCCLPRKPGRDRDRGSGMMRAIRALMALWCTTSPVLAEEVMDCVDTQSVGFVWDKAGKVRQRPFIEDRHRVEVLSDTQCIITP